MAQIQHGESVILVHAQSSGRVEQVKSSCLNSSTICCEFLGLDLQVILKWYPYNVHYEYMDCEAI